MAREDKKTEFVKTESELGKLVSPLFKEKSLNIYGSF